MPLHYLWKLFGARSPWPRLFLGFAGAARGLRVRDRGHAADRQRPVRRQPCQLARHPRARRRDAGRSSSPSDDVERLAGGRLAGRAQRHRLRRPRRRGAACTARPTRSARALAERPRGRPVPGRDDRRRPRAPAVPRQPVRLALPAARRASWSSRSRSIMARLRDEIAWVGDEPAGVNARRVLARPGTLPVTLRFLEPVDPPRPATARRWPRARAGRDRRGAAALSNRGGRSPIGRGDDRPAIPETFHVKSFGCQMNVYDGERMAELLEAEGMTRGRRRRRGRPRRAQHLPHPREGGREGLFGHRPAGEARATATQPMIAVAGCVAQAEGAEIPRRAPGVDIVVGPQAYHHLPELVARGRQRAARALDTDMPAALQVRRAAGAAPAGAERLPDRPGRLRQILHLLRRALYARRRGLAARARRSLDEAKALVDARRARDHPARPERQRLGARTTGSGPRRTDPRARRAAGPRSGSATRPAIPTT